MDYRRNEGFVRQSSSLRLRDPYENVDRVEASHRTLRRSVSPNGSAQEAGVSQMTGSVERREYGWPLDRPLDRVRTGRVRSRSPPAIVLGDARKRPHYDSGVNIPPRNFSPTPSVELRHRRELGEGKNLIFENDDADFHSMRAYGYERNDPRSTSAISKEDFDEMSLSAGGQHQLLGQNSAAAKDLARGSYRSPTHLGATATSVYGDAGGKLPMSSRAMDSQHFEQGRIQYQDTMALDRLPVTHSYKDGENPVMRSRDVAYHILSGPNSKALASSSSEMSRHEYLSYQDSLHLPHTNEFKSSVKFNEPTALNVYRERSLLDSARDQEGGQRNPNFFLREYSPNKGEQENYVYHKNREIVDDRGYLADDLPKMMAPRAQLEYGRTQIIYDRRDMPRPSITHSVVDRNDNIDGPGGNLRQGITYYQPALEKRTDSDYLDMRRAPHNMLKQGGEYLGSGFTHLEIGREVSQDHEVLHVGAPINYRISGIEADYGFGGDGGSQFQEERLLGSPVSKYENEMNRQDVRMQNMRDEHGIYEPQDRVVKGKYSIQEDHARSYNPRKTLSGKLYSARQFQDLRETDEEWINEEMSGLYASTKMGFEHTGYRRTERKFDGMGNREDFQSDVWFSSQELPHGRKQPIGFHKNYGRQFKGNRRPGYVSYHNSHHYDRKDQLYRQRNQFDRKNHLYRQHNNYERKNHLYSQQKVWKKNEGYYEDLHAEDGNNGSDPSDDWVSPEESALAEDSEEFKQMVNDAFLKYSRMLNVNPAVQRRYKEEGKAGSLFCIVCGRSASKEFMDTRRLVTHAFMSHKAGLRADHLGLHKAICVLLGWSTDIPEDTITWVPQVLPKAQALAQKEDLILWPPVIVVHNISFSDSNPEKWKVVTMEALEAFIRGKGFIRGRIKVCLGKPADQSVMVVKFLGTFTGLGDAEKLHKYFVEQKRGRIDFELATSNNVEISISKEAEKVEENILYGYLGISEDLDKVDYMTRNTGLIKSKIEIQDLANAPVKPEETLQ